MRTSVANRRRAPFAAALAGGLIGWLAFSELIADAERVGALVLVGVTAAVVALDRLWRIALPALVAAWFVVIGAIELVPRVIDPAPSVSEAVGGAAYFGTPFLGREIGLAVAIGAILVAIVGAAILARRRRWIPPIANGGPPDAVAPGWRSDRRIAFAAGVVAAATLVPELGGYFAGIASDPDWDRSNLELWDYLVWQGEIPMADFFYPYGSQWLYSVVPVGPWVLWLARVAMVAIAGWALWRLSEGRAAAVAVCLLAIPLVGFADESLWRYLPSFLMALTYAATGPASHAAPGRGQLAFAAACLLTAVLEIDLLVYGLAGCGLIVIADAVCAVLPRGRVAILRGLLADAVPVLGAVAVVAALWLVSGSTEGNLRFFGGLGAVSAASAPYLLLAPGLDQLSLAPSAQAIYLASPALFIVAGFAWAVARGPGTRPIAAILLAAAGVTLLFAFKDLVRPTDDRLLVIALLAVIWGLVMVPRLTTAVAAFAAAFTVALALTIEDGDDPLSDYGERLITSPVRAVEMALLPARTDEFDRDLASRFEPERYEGFPEVEIARQYTRALGARGGGGDASDFAVIGDAQLLYAFFGTGPPYHAELYDAAPIAEQREMLRRLEREPPRYLIWRQDFAIDQVPYPVRDPLIFSWAVDNYVPLPVAGPGSTAARVLVERRPGQPIAVDWWQRELGASELGHVPSYSELDQGRACREPSEGCTAVAIISHKTPAAGQPVELALVDGGRSFSVRFAPREGVATYAVRLDRLWFFGLLDRGSRIQTLTPGTEVLTRSIRSDALY